jgi:hypothetical protein
MREKAYKLLSTIDIMDLQKYPTYFLITILLYIFTLLLGLGYLILPGITMNLYSDSSFYTVFIPIILPLVLLAVYAKYELSDRLKRIIRFLVTFFAMLDMIIIFFLLLLLI